MRLGVRLSVNASSLRVVTVAAAQFDPIIGDRANNLKAIERLVRLARDKGADIVVLPELADSGYMFCDAEEVAALACPVPSGPSADALGRLAQELSVHIVSGIAERDGDRFYNTAMLCGPNGYIGKYRKLHLWNNENLLFTKGDLGFPVFDLPFGRLGIAICYDGWFPETFRKLTFAGAELVCIPTNWVPAGSPEAAPEPMANILHMAAAHSNGIYIACADRIGIERGQRFIGRSMIVGPEGWPLAGPASADREELLLAQIDLSSVAGARSLNTFNHLLRDRRADVYG